MSALVQRLRGWAAGWNPYDPAHLTPKGEGIEPVLLEESQVRRSAVRIVVVTFALFFAWAVLAPLDAGVVMEGNVTVAGNRKSVQHPGGGVVQELLVREGTQVHQGDVVLKVNPLDSEANLTGAELQYINLLATESRLLAERTGSEIRWKPELAQFGASDTRVAEAKMVQLQLLGSRRAELESQQHILREQLTSQQAQAQSMVKVITEKRSQLELVAREARNTVQLAKEGYVPESKANEVLRTQSALQSDMANLAAEASRTQASIASTQLQAAQQRSAYLKDIDNQLSELQKNREAFLSRVESLKFARNLTEVKAPVSGTVVALKVNTVGGVISAGQVLMEIVPAGGKLIVEAQVPPVSIDKVKQGLPADLRFSAFNQRNTPVIAGVVKLVGADKVTEPNGKGEFYLAQIETTEDGLKRLGEHRIQPGMPVEVIVKTGERSFMSYLVKPLTDRFARSFKED
ncbi:HlyD family type I secretion periplasmic adaptor subunit [Azohydromonas lata]|uniref:Membrane fusion protein (MFP) family protein n=1 Tax=Azohydromonas lata TaxID=45677 RepID=A0ABU5IN37_9BURK|nr:HlyD family type I secretion periplasmic adaptor subunit [Azohydromonas lata]MDZ5460316.1 HlyD family type I secretion periplasmic adaptor subunit [Azohydromonas lata]